MTGHYPREKPSTSLFVRRMPAAVMAKLGRFCQRNRVTYPVALAAIIPAGIKALTGKKEG